LLSMRVTARQTGKGKHGTLGVAKARRDGFRAVEGGSLAGFWARKGGGFGSGLRPNGDEVRFGAASRAPRRRYWGVRAGEMVRSRARVCVRVRC
jgi:hypothetical protein